MAKKSFKKLEHLRRLQMLHSTPAGESTPVPATDLKSDSGLAAPAPVVISSRHLAIGQDLRRLGLVALATLVLLAVAYWAVNNTTLDQSLTNLLRSSV